MNVSRSAPSFSTLFYFLKPHQRWIWVSVLFSIIVGLIDISLAILSQHLLDRVIGSKETAQVMPIVYAIMAAITIGVVCKFVIKYASIHFSSNVLQTLRAQLFKKFVKMPVAYAEERHSGELSSRINNDAATLEQVLENKFYEYIYHPIVFVCAFAYLIQINWKLLLFSIVLMPTSTYLIGRLARPLDRMSEEVQAKYGGINTAVQDMVGGVPVLKAYNLEAVFRRKFAGLLNSLFQLTIRVEKRKAWMEPVNTLQVWGTYFLCTILSAYLSTMGYITVGELLVFLVLINQLIHPITALPNLISNYKLTIAASARIAEVLEEQDERTDGARLDALQFDPSRAVLEFQGVSFGYIPNQPILRNIHLSLRKGEMLAVVGPSGSGKTTMMQLLCGFQEPQEGEIVLFGQTAKCTALQDLRSHISLVSQDSYLFPGTITENLLIANPQANLEQIIQAAKAANAHEFIEKLPLGYDTMVEERGANFSGGQKQRLAIARALLKDAEILLLDEPTSALDKQSEKSIQEALERIKHDRSVIVIAHRLSTVVNADQIVVLEKGTILQSGTHGELLRQEGLYKELFRLQQSGLDVSGQGGGLI